MILLQIKSVKKVKAKKWEHNDLSKLKPGQDFVRFMGNHPDNPEYGSVVISAKLISGSFDGIGEILFIGDDGHKGVLVNHKKQLFGGYSVEIRIDTVFAHGLEYCALNFIQSSIAIIGLTLSEKDSLNSFDIHEKLLQTLTEFIIPQKKELITNWSKPGYLCIPNDKKDTYKSHYMGSPKHHASKIQDNKGNELCHLVNLQFAEFPGLNSFPKKLKELSFYLKIDDSINGWPEGPDDSMILSGNDVITDHHVSQNQEPSNITISPILDIPRSDHSLLQKYRFTDDEKYLYNSLWSIYRYLILEGTNLMEVEEYNKFLGYADNVQNCVSYEAERIHNKREFSDEIFKDATEWCLLLQISPYCKWFSFFDDFGDGSIFFMIKEKDLIKGDFSRCQVVVQNT